MSFNQTLLDWTGYDSSTLLGGRSFAELLTPGGRIYYETHYAPTLQMQGFAREIAFDIVCADGRRLPALVNATIDDERTGPRRIRVAIFDATERRLYERELLAAKGRAEASEAHARLLARTLQQTLIPHELPRVRGLDLAAVYRPAGAGDEIGGDFYDVFQIGVDDWMVIIGDVQGKGVDAAVVTALARHSIRAAAVEHEEPSAALRVLNDVLLRHESRRLCTAVVLRFREHGGRWTVTICCAGHPLPVVTRGAEPAVDAGAPGTILGVLESVTLQDVDVDLERGQMIVVYTDGVSDARRGSEFFGEARIRELVGRGSRDATEVTELLLAEALAFESNAPGDDIAIVAVRVE